MPNKVYIYKTKFTPQIKHNELEMPIVKSENAATTYYITASVMLKIIYTTVTNGLTIIVQRATTEDMYVQLAMIT